MIDFLSPSEEAVCLHEAGHAAAALVVGIQPVLMEFITAPDSQAAARVSVPPGNDKERRLIAAGAFATEVQLFKAGRLTDQNGVPIEEKAFMQTALGGNADRDKVNYFGADLSAETGSWSQAHDLEFARYGEGLAKHMPIGLVTALAEGMLNLRRVDQAAILKIFAPFKR